MPGGRSLLRTEVRGLDLCLDEDSLAITTSGEDQIAAIALTAEDAERLRIEMAKAQLWEWNQLEELQARTVLRSRRYLAAWLVMCLAAFSAYLSYPSFYLPLFFALLSIALWWRAGIMEQKAAQEAQAQRNSFKPEWEYLRQRLEETE